MTPLKFTWEEGGDMLPWPDDAGEPPISFYSKRHPLSVYYTKRTRDMLKGWAVHSLITPFGWRWDCINGWTGRR